MYTRCSRRVKTEAKKIGKSRAPSPAHVRRLFVLVLHFPVIFPCFDCCFQMCRDDEQRATDEIQTNPLKNSSRVESVYGTTEVFDKK